MHFIFIRHILCVIFICHFIRYLLHSSRVNLESLAFREHFLPGFETTKRVEWRFFYEESVQGNFVF